MKKLIKTLLFISLFSPPLLTAGQKLSTLNETTTPSTTDYMYVISNSSSQKVQVGVLLNLPGASTSYLTISSATDNQTWLKNGTSIYYMGSAVGVGTVAASSQFAVVGGIVSDFYQAISAVSTSTFNGYLASKFPVADIRAYGAVGDGTTDDTTAIQAAMNASKYVFVPSGTFVASNLTATPGQVVFGLGTYSTILFKTGSTGYLFTCGRAQFYNLDLNGGNVASYQTTSGAGTRSGIYIDLTKERSMVHNVSIRGFNNIALGYSGDTSSGEDALTVSNCFLSYNYTGIDTGSTGTGGEYTKIIGNSINWCYYGIRNRSGNTTITANAMTNNGIGLDVPYITNGGHSTCVGNLINHSKYYSIRITDNLVGYTITGNQVFYGNMSITGSDGITITNNSLAVGDMVLSGDGFISFTNNYFYKTPYIQDTNSRTVWSGNYDAIKKEYIDYTKPLLVDSNIVYVSSTIYGASGPNKVTNGDFASDTIWTKGTNWSISGGVAVAANATSSIYQTIGSSAHYHYLVTWTVLNRTGGSVAVGVTGSGSHTTVSANGTYSHVIYGIGSDHNLYISGTGFTGQIDNVAVYEYDVTSHTPGKFGIWKSCPTYTLDVDGAISSTATFITALNCTSNANGGAVTTDANGQLVCSDDDMGSGGSGTTINIEDGGSSIIATSTVNFTGSEFVITNDGGEALVKLDPSSVTMYGASVVTLSSQAASNIVNQGQYLFKSTASQFVQLSTYSQFTATIPVSYLGISSAPSKVTFANTVIGNLPIANLTVNASSYWNYPSTGVFVSQHGMISTSTITGGTVTAQTALVMPSGSSPDVSVSGEIALDTTGDQVLTHNGASLFVVSQATKCYSISVSSGLSWNNIAIPGPRKPYAYTIKSVVAVANGGTSVTFNLEERASGSEGSAGTDVFASDQVADTDNIALTSFSNAGIAAGAKVYVTTGASAASGAVELLSIDVCYQEDRQ